MATPTKGRHVDYHDGPQATNEAAVVIKINDEHSLNLQVFHEDGTISHKQNVYFRKEDEGVPECAYCCWPEAMRPPLPAPEDAPVNGDPLPVDSADEDI